MAWATGESLMSLSGEEPSFRLWQTFVFEQIDGQWKLVHGHVSIPAEDNDLKHKDAV